MTWFFLLLPFFIQMLIVKGFPALAATQAISEKVLDISRPG